MPHISWLDVFGYAASVVVAISLMMGSVLKLRWWNLVGSGAFTLYGLLIQSRPVAILNAFIVLVNIYYLVNLYRRREHFEAIPLPEDSPYLARVLEAHREEIVRIFPGFEHRPSSQRVGLCVLRDLIPVSFLLGTPDADGTLRVDLDYALPPYRDLRPGGFLFRERQDLFRDLGIRRLRARTADRVHADYLRRVGFREEMPAGGGRSFLLEMG